MAVCKKKSVDWIINFSLPFIHKTNIVYISSLEFVLNIVNIFNSIFCPNKCHSSGIMFLTSLCVLTFLLGPDETVGSKLDLMQPNSEGGSRGRNFPYSVSVGWSFGRCERQLCRRNNSVLEFGIFSLGIMVIHLILSSGFFGRLTFLLCFQHCSY